MSTQTETPAEKSPTFDTSTTPAQRADRAAHEAYVARVTAEVLAAKRTDG